jgi:long-chain acyl-CoA synthetase
MVNNGDFKWTEQTSAKLLKRNRERWADKVWMRKKEFGFWQTYTWEQGYQKVKEFSLGLKALGFQRGDMLAIQGDNNPQWFWGELASQALGGVVSGVHSGCSPVEVEYLVNQCDASFILVQDQEQVDKQLQILDKLPNIKKVIYWDPKGMRHYDKPILMNWDEVSQLGREYEASHPGAFEEEIDKGQPSDLALIQYTSGTTGRPKGAIFDYQNLFAFHDIFNAMYPLNEKDEWFSFVLPGWMAEQGIGLGGSLAEGVRMNFPEKLETVQENIREIGPSVLFYPATMWEYTASLIQNRILETIAPWRFLYNLCLPVGYKVANMKFQDQKPNLFWRGLYKLCDLMVFRALRDKLGLLKTKLCFTSGSTLAPEVFRMMRAIGLDLLNVYWATETVLSGHTRTNIKVDSVGIPSPYTTIRILEDGHILAIGPSRALGYYKNEQATQEKFADGWYHTGDAGYMDDEGHIYCLDRLEYMATLKDGTRYAPSFLESRLKFSHYVKQVFTVGDGRDFIGAVISIDYDNVGHWAERRGIPYATLADLSQKPQVCELIRGEVAQLNAKVPESMRIKRFVNIPKVFHVDESELTHTMKAKRKFLEERYSTIISAIYGESERAIMEVPVVYRDGRQDVIKADIKVNSLE